MLNDLHRSLRKSTRRAKYITELELKESVLTPGLVAKWNTKEKVKTAAAALVVCLNIGVDPPGHVRISPFPVLHCWMDPISAHNSRALESIGKNLQNQYERWQPKAKYTRALDPTKEQVRKACMNLRRSAKSERVLFHYNGHGVPKPTCNGEIWVFDAQYTQYIPLSVYDLQCWIGNPVMYVFDCPSAGTVLESVKSFMSQAEEETGMSTAMDPFLASNGDPMKGTIMMAACRDNELLDTDPNLPADLFTSCLTTPIKVALRWLLSRCSINSQKISLDIVDSIPGLLQDRKSPLGELNWIFTAVTDTIAWDVLPSDLFQKLFRQDLLVASLFRNFLLAERIMSSMSVMPVSYPRLPPTFNHQMWKTWDLAAEKILMQLPALHLKRPTREFQTSSFFTDQLDSFSLSLKSGSSSKSFSRQLPILLQALLSPVHRVRALELLYQFLEMGIWAMELALSVGVFPYVLKLLQATPINLQPTLISIWTKIMAIDAPCQVELHKDNGYQYFIRYLEGESQQPTLTYKAAAVLAFLCYKNPQAQSLCLKTDLLTILVKFLQEEKEEVEEVKWQIRKWICLCLGSLIDGRTEGISIAIRVKLPELLFEMLTVQDPEMRAAIVFALRSLLSPTQGVNELQTFDLELMERLSSTCLRLVYDPSCLVRGEIGALLSLMVQKPGHSTAFEMTMLQLQKDAESQISALQRYLSAIPSSILKPGNELGLSCPTSGDSLHGQDIVRWTTEDAVQFHPMDSTAHNLSIDSSQSMELHRNVVQSLCILSMDTIPEVALMAKNAFNVLEWEVEFLSLKKIKDRIPDASFPESSLQSSLLHPIVSLRLSKNRNSRHSLDSNAQGSGQSSTSTSSEFPDYQEQTRIFQTRIELATKHTQRRPFRLKKKARRNTKETVESKFTGRASHGSFKEESSPKITRSLLHDVYPLPSGVQYLKTCSESWIFDFCRRVLAEPSYTKLSPVVEHKIERARRRSYTGDSLSEFKLSEQVLHVKTQAENIGCVLLDASRDYLAVSDREGKIMIHDYGQEEYPEISSFSLADQKDENNVDVVDIVSLFSLGAMSSLDCLLACNADGSVRVWENCLESETCRLRSGWQAIPITSPPNYVLTPACFAWQSLSGMLFSSGLSAPGVIHQFDLEYETLIQQFVIEKNSHPSIDFLRIYDHNQSLLAAASDDGMIRVFDIRTENFVGGMRPFPNQGGPISGICPLTDEKLCVLSYGGLMKMLDIRQTSTSIVSSLVASTTIKAHSTGCTSALVAHLTKPVIASGTLHPVVKIWNLEGEQVSSIRPLRSYKENCQQAVTCMSFHPSEWRFAAAGRGSVCGIYNFKQKT